MAHAQGADGIKNAVRAGIRSIDHGIYLDDEAIELMKARGTWFVPTLVAPQGVIDAADAGIDLPPVVIDKARLRRRRPSVAFRQRSRRRPDRDGHRQWRHPHGRQPRELASSWSTAG
jgi:hypothetical protein